jgi:hypothetical protein
MGNHVHYRESDPTPPPSNWPKRRIFLWSLLFISIGALAFVGWALST